MPYIGERIAKHNRIAKSIILTDPLIAEFAFGIFICHAYKRYSETPLWFGILSISVGGYGLFMYPETSTALPDSRYLTGGIPTAIFMFGPVNCERFIKNNPLPFLEKLGDSSYSLYLFHPFPLAAADIAFRKIGGAA